MAKEYTKVKKIICDFCQAEIEASTPLVAERTTLNDKPIAVEIRVYSPDRKRFTDDICRACVFEAADLIFPLKHRAQDVVNPFEEKATA